MVDISEEERRHRWLRLIRRSLGLSGLAFVVPLVVDWYLLRRILAAGPSR
jgi:hypothetical protein